MLGATSLEVVSCLSAAWSPCLWATEEPGMPPSASPPSRQPPGALCEGARLPWEPCQLSDDFTGRDGLAEGRS